MHVVEAAIVVEEAAIVVEEAATVVEEAAMHVEEAAEQGVIVVDATKNAEESVVKADVIVGVTVTAKEDQYTMDVGKASNLIRNARRNMQISGMRVQADATVEVNHVVIDMNHPAHQMMIVTRVIARLLHPFVFPTIHSRSSCVHTPSSTMHSPSTTRVPANIP